MKKFKLFAMLFVVLIMAVSLSGCFGKRANLEVSVAIEDYQTVMALNHKLYVYYGTDTLLYSISLMPSETGFEVLNTYPDEDLVVYLEIFEAAYSMEGFDINDVVVYSNGIALTENSRWNYGNGCEFKYNEFQTTEDIVFTVDGATYAN